MSVWGQRMRTAMHEGGRRLGPTGQPSKPAPYPITTSKEKTLPEDRHARTGN